eukprot:TRINITY_DN882_c1_g1_i1.p1 TRINITY_DN882_c1_g1~~TRINITY_DN882_c1_g1_i1.p1  ORF type:complete len:267 (+),score=20.16 TRINITY_DN882_c1_g1_i1:78-878(+)
MLYFRDGVLFIRSLVHKRALLPLATRMGIKKVRPRRKFAESSWFFIYYVPIFCWGFREIVFHDLAWPMAQMFSFYPQLLHTFSLKLYLLIQLSFYLSAFVVVTILEERRKDFLEMTLHHLATVALIIWSSITCYRNVAVVILTLHDFSDMFLYLTKSLHYAKCKNVKNYTFGTFAMSFFISRLIYFPMIILFWLFESPNMIEVKWKYPHIYSRTFAHSVTVLVCLLLMLHMFWFKQIIKTIKKAMSETDDDYQDPRSHSEKEDGDD